MEGRVREQESLRGLALYHLQTGKSLPPLYNGNGGVLGSDHSLQGQVYIEVIIHAVQAHYLPVFQVSTFLTPRVFLMEGSSLRETTLRRDLAQLVYVNYYCK